MEQAFGQEAYSGNEFSAFMRDFSHLKTAEILAYLVYEVFTIRTPTSGSQCRCRILLSDLHIIAIRYCRVVLGKETDPELKAAFHDLRELKVNVVNPLLLELYSDYEADLLSRVELLNAYALGGLCVPPCRVLDPRTHSRKPSPPLPLIRREPEHYLASFKAHLLHLPSYRRFPPDQNSGEIQIRNLYKFNKSCSYSVWKPPAQRAHCRGGLHD